MCRKIWLGTITQGCIVWLMMTTNPVCYWTDTYSTNRPSVMRVPTYYTTLCHCLINRLIFPLQPFGTTFHATAVWFAHINMFDDSLVSQFGSQRGDRIAWKLLKIVVPMPYVLTVKPEHVSGDLVPADRKDHRSWTSSSTWRRCDHYLVTVWPSQTYYTISHRDNLSNNSCFL